LVENSTTKNFEIFLRGILYPLKTKSFSKRIFGANPEGQIFRENCFDCKSQNRSS